MKHTELRAAVLDALEKHDTGATLFDGRPAVFDEEDLAENSDLAEMLDEFDSYIGELFISIDKAKEQAEDYNHSFEREMGFLAVHGFLHINGYDHMEPDEAAVMESKQREILDNLGITR